ncbi:hypothetical protein CHS0354_012623 [Potamilus streckersoni]|uniref:Uncharacterized protein n=1 Tax=Potamilus streckersoni TaxID=2493646 RepID=A0AAE0W4I6_9BIVA|nr:hypothetical protein CHS0354_012623 [Potamilus streckersoni]
MPILRRSSRSMGRFIALAVTDVPCISWRNIIKIQQLECLWKKKGYTVIDLAVYIIRHTSDYLQCLWTICSVDTIGNCSTITIPTNYSSTISVNNSTILSTTPLSKMIEALSDTTILPAADEDNPSTTNYNNWTPNITTITSKATTNTLLTTGEISTFNNRTITSMKTDFNSVTITQNINGLSSTYTITSSNLSTSTLHSSESSITKWTTNPPLSQISNVTSSSAQHGQGNTAFEGTEIVILFVILTVSAIAIVIALVFGRMEFRQPKINLNNLENLPFEVMTSI